MSRRHDVQDATGRLIYLPGRGTFLAWASGQANNTTTGVPTNGTTGFAPGCIWINDLGGPGTAVYVNIGTFTSSQWIDIDSPDGGLVSLTASLTLSALLHSGRTMLLNVSGGMTATLPAATATGNIYRFIVQTVSATGYIVQTDGTAVFTGSPFISIPGQTAAGNFESFNTSTLKHFTLNGTTTGGAFAGDWFEIQDIATNVWSIKGMLTGSGTLATPFS